MISVEQAKSTISNSCKVKPIIKVDLLSAVGFILAENIIAKISIPGFDNSAMDGYAIQHNDIETYWNKNNIRKSTKMVYGKRSKNN